MCTRYHKNVHLTHINDWTLEVPGALFVRELVSDDTFHCFHQTFKDNPLEWTKMNAAATVPDASFIITIRSQWLLINIYSK